MSGQGAGRARPRSRRPANWGSQPLGLWWLLPVGLAVAVVLLFTTGVQQAGYAIAGTLGMCALLRLVLPREAVGGLLVRSKAWDVLTLLVLAAAVTGVSASLVIR